MATSPEESEPEDPLLSRLAQFDETLSLGGSLSDEGKLEPLSEEDQARLAGLEKCIAWLELTWPRGANADVAATPTDPVPPDTAPHSEPGAPPMTVGLRPIGRFELRQELGRGGFGVVYLAFDPTLRREVALKVPRPEVLLSQDLRQRFLREAQAAALLEHPNIVPVFETGEVGGLLYMASAYCPGSTLSAWMRERPELPSPTVAARIVAQLARALAHAHERGVFHRDLKPANILLQVAEKPGRDELPFVPRITDFGLAKVLSAGSDTKSGMLIGTPAYMAPEMFDSAAHVSGPGGDIYALGVMLYELLTGNVPFRGDTDWQTVARMTSEDPVTVRRLRPSIPRDLETICHRCLEREPARRYSSAASLEDDLENFLAGRPIIARPASRFERTMKWARRQPMTATLAALVVVGTIGMIAGAIDYQIELRSALREAKAHRQVAEARERQTAALLYASDMNLASSAWNDGDAFTARLVHGRHRVPTAGSDFRGLEWFIYDRLFHPELAVLGPLAGATYMVAASPDGRWIATGGQDYVVRVWDAKSLTLARSLKGHTGEVNWVAFAPDSRSLVSASDDQTARIWDVATGTERRALRTPDSMVVAALFSPDGQRVILGCRDFLVTEWAADTGERIRQWKFARDGLECLDCSANGEWLACCSTDKGDILLWRRDSGKPRRLHHPSGALCVAFSPDSKQLASTLSYGEVIIWDVAQGKVVQELPRHAHRSVSVAWSPDGKHLACGSMHGALVLFDLTMKPPKKHILHGHEKDLWGVGFTPDSRRIYSASRDGSVRVWSAQPPGMGREMERTASDVAVSPDGRHRLLLGDDGGLIRCDADQEVPVRPDLRFRVGSRLSVSNAGMVVGEAPNPDRGSLLVASLEASVPTAALPLENGYSEAPHHLSPFAWCMSADSRWLILATRRTGEFMDVTSWDMASMREVARRRLAHKNEFGGGTLAIAPDGSRVVVVSDKEPRVLAIPDLAEIAVLSGHTAPATAVAFFPDGERVATGGQDSTVRVWDLRGPKILDTYFHNMPVQEIAIAPNGKTIVSATRARLRFWMVETSQAVGSIEMVEADYAHRLLFFPDSSALWFLRGFLRDGLHGKAKCSVFDATSRSLPPTPPVASSN